MSAGRRRPAAVLAVVALQLFAAAIAATAGMNGFAIVLMVLAMDAENAVFHEQGEVRFGLTYMTGALVKLGQKLAAMGWPGFPMRCCGPALLQV